MNGNIIIRCYFLPFLLFFHYSVILIELYGVRGCSEPACMILWNWAMGRGWKNFWGAGLESIDYFEQMVSKNMSVKDSATEGSKKVKTMVEKTQTALRMPK